MAHQAGVIQQFCPVECIILSSSELLGRAPRPRAREGIKTWQDSHLAVLAFSALSGDQFLSWGWRVPFWASIVMVAIGLYIRLGIVETPA